MKKLALVFGLIGFMAVTSPAFAAGQVVKAHVNGLVCDFCARALEKVFGKQEAVEDIDVNLDTKIITIGLTNGDALSDEAITGLIEDSGYNVEKIEREDGAGGDE